MDSKDIIEFNGIKLYKKEVTCRNIGIYPLTDLYSIKLSTCEIYYCDNSKSNPLRIRKSPKYNEIYDFYVKDAEVKEMMVNNSPAGTFIFDTNLKFDGLKNIFLEKFLIVSTIASGKPITTGRVIDRDTGMTISLSGADETITSSFVIRKSKNEKGNLCNGKLELVRSNGNYFIEDILDIIDFFGTKIYVAMYRGLDFKEMGFNEFIYVDENGNLMPFKLEGKMPLNIFDRSKYKDKEGVEVEYKNGKLDFYYKDENGEIKKIEDIE